MKKYEIAKALGLVGTLLGIAATLISNYASEKQMKAEVAEQVEEQIKALQENNSQEG